MSLSRRRFLRGLGICMALPAFESLSPLGLLASPMDAKIRGAAGEHQVEGAHTALGHAYGGGSQFFSMWILRDTEP